eukprot:SAG31_NODE_29724_length_390_cov_9.010309_1_plen_62_part_10
MAPLYPVPRYSIYCSAYWYRAGDCFFFSRWLAEFTLKQVPLPNVTTPAPLQSRWQAVQLAVA